MTPNDLDAYLKVLADNKVGSAAIKLSETVQFSVTFVPQFPVQLGVDPTPGGWKSPGHLDDPEALRGDGDYKGELPS